MADRTRPAGVVHRFGCSQGLALAEPLSARTAIRSAALANALLPPGSAAWSESARGAIRGVTVGPIESALHPKRGYGSEPFERSLLEAKRLGSSWVSLTPFARVNDLKSTGISLSFRSALRRK